MLSVKNLNYDSWQTIYFQRATVIVSELVLAFALDRYDFTNAYGIRGNSSLLSRSADLSNRVRSQASVSRASPVYRSFSPPASSLSTISTFSTMGSSTAFSSSRSCGPANNRPCCTAELRLPACCVSSTSTCTWRRRGLCICCACTASIPNPFCARGSAT